MVRKTRRGPPAIGPLDLDSILHALRGDDALVILRRLADRDPKWAKVIETMAKDLLSAVDADDVAAEVLAGLESLSVEDVWDRAGPRRDGYSDPGDVAAEMIDEALAPYVHEGQRLIGLGMQVPADGLFRGLLRGIYDFGTAAATPFRDEAADSVAEHLDHRLANLTLHCRRSADGPIRYPGRRSTATFRRSAMQGQGGAG